MSEHLKVVRENAYFKVCIINLIEAIEDIEELSGIRSYLRDVIDGIEPNTHKEETEKIANYFKILEEEKGSGVNERKSEI